MFVLKHTYNDICKAREILQEFQCLGGRENEK